MHAKLKSLTGSLLLALLILGSAWMLLDGWGGDVLPVYAQGTARYVAPDGSDSGTCDSVANRCRTVQYAVDHASAGDAILIAGGVYTANGAEAIADISKNLTLRGGYTTSDNFTVSDPDAHPTLLDGEGGARGVYIHNSGVNVTLENLRITGGNAAGVSDYAGYGGGVLVASGAIGNNATAVISNCVVYSNTAHSSGPGYGGGVDVYRHATATIRDSQILSNTAGTSGSGYGGGIASHSFTTLNVYDSLVRGNLASYSGGGNGGGIYLNGYPSVLQDNQILSNTASTTNGGYGGGIYIDDSPTVENNTVRGNRVTASGTWGQGGGICIRSTTTGIVRRNLVQGNQAPYGGGISYEDEDATLDGNRVINNTATDRGGGLYVIASGTAEFHLDNLVIADNSGANGAGIYLASGRPTFRHLTLVGNAGGDGRGLYVAEYSGGVMSATLRSSIIATQTVGVYVYSGEEAHVRDSLWHNVNTKSEGPGSFTDENPRSGDPAFVNPAAGDYHLTEDSAAKDVCADTGLAHDFEGDPRPGGAGPDCGADELFESGLLLTKQADRVMVGLDETLTYTLHLTVTSLDVHNIILTDTLDVYQQPVRMTASQGACALHDAGWGGSVVCNLGTVAYGDSVAFTLTAHTTATAPFPLPHPITNTAIARGDEAAAEAQTGLELQACRVRLVEGSSVITYTNIQAAIDAASTITGEVQVAGSCFDVTTRGGHTQVVYLDKTLTLRGGYDLDFATWDPEAYPTVLDARQQGRGLYLTGVGITPTVESLHLTGGVGEDIGQLFGDMYNTGGYYAGGGIYAGPNVRAVISGCHVYENRGLSGAGYIGSDRMGMGGGILLDGAAVTLRYTQVYSNVAAVPRPGATAVEDGYGGGVALVNADDAMLEYNTIHNNTATPSTSDQGYGGGLYLLDSAAQMLTNTFSGNVAGTDSSYYCAGGGLMVDGDAPLIQGNTFSSNIASQGQSGGGGGLMLFGSQAQVIDNTFQDNIATTSSGGGYGGGVMLDDGDRSTLTENWIVGNVANAGSGAGYGGGVRIDSSGPLTLTGNLIEGNDAALHDEGRGGGVNVDEGDRVLLAGNTIQENRGSVAERGVGGGILIDTASTVILLQNFILTNTAGYTYTTYPPSGGGVALREAGTVDLISNTVRGNVAGPASAGRGGGLYVQGSTVVTLTGNTVADNVASTAGDGDGGGMFVSFESAVVARGNTWQGNTATTGAAGTFGSYGYGGGLYLDDVSAFTATNDVWQENTASDAGVGQGGGLYVEDSTLVMEDTTVRANTTGSGTLSGSGYGGGLYTMGDTTLNVSRVHFVDNVAVEGGGGLYLRGASLWFTNTLIAGNHAGWEGAGASVKDVAHFLHTTIVSNTGSEGVYIGYGPDADVVFDESVIAGHTVGVYADSHIEMNGVLWHDNVTDTMQDGGIAFAYDQYWGDPRFADPENGDYHLLAGSAAIDRAEPSAVDNDLDGLPRPWGGGPDLGAYESHAGFTLSPGYNEAITPGELYTHTHFLRNNSLTADTYTLTLSTDRDWSTLHTGSPVSVEAGEAVTVEIAVSIPDGTPYDLFETVMLTATSHNDPGLTASPINWTRAGLTGVASLTPERSSTVMAGETVVYTHTLVNETNAAQSFTLVAASSEEYAVTVIPTATGGLSAFGGSAVITVAIETWVWEISGTVDLTIITATGNLGNIAVATDVTTILEADNYPPTADAGAAQTVDPGAVVTLDGSASADPDGDDLTFGWVQTGGTDVTFTPNLSLTTFTAPHAVGVLTFTLTVTDTGGLSDSATTIVTVTNLPPCNSPAAVGITGSSTATLATPVTFTATVEPLTSTAILPMTFPLTYTWEASGLPSQIHAINTMVDTVTFTWIVAGPQAITVTVQGPCGDPVSDIYLITVSGDHRSYLPLVLRQG